MRTLVLGDIHGAAKALDQVLERSKFDPTNGDRIIFLGDICDGWSETVRAMDILMAIPKDNLIWLKGNHDEWTLTWLKSDWAQHMWVSQGGRATMDSFREAELDTVEQRKPYAEALWDALWYHIEDNKCFVHGGLGWSGFHPMKLSEEALIWDREMLQCAKDGKAVEGFDEVYVGHTSTTFFGTTEPLNLMNVWDIDTGAGWSGKLTIMDIDTKEFWQSDLAPDLYPEEVGRR